MNDVLPSRILCVIDHLGSGGAQRQLVNLAIGLKRMGHDVEFFIYHSAFRFFSSDLAIHAIPVTTVEGIVSPLRILSALIKLIQTRRPDVIISFLQTPNVYTCIARLTRPQTRLIASERNSHLDDKGRFAILLKRLLLVFANAVVTNSQAHANWLRQRPWLRKKTHVIYNGYAIPAHPAPLSANQTDGLRLIGIGRVQPQKNLLTLVKALAHFERLHGYCPEVRWIGYLDRRAKYSSYLAEVETQLANNPRVRANWTWLGERSDVNTLMADADALILPSLYEGMPNAACEAFAQGRPVLASNVCDNGLLVQEGNRGFLFDPRSKYSIVAALERFTQLSPAERKQMGHNCHQYASAHLTIENLSAQYCRILFSS